MTPDPLEYYVRPGRMTDAGPLAHLFDGLPRDIGELAGVIQGLLLHEHWSAAYGVSLTDERRAESQIRPVAQMLDRLLALDARPLSVARTLDKRLIGICRHISVLAVAMLRAQGVPARARCGFGAYFNAGSFEDHWVCEYWNAAEQRWILVDAQLDALQRAAIRPDFDPRDVPRDRFVQAGDAWAQCRAGAADPGKFGIFDLRGLWFIAGNVLRDAAALNQMELLPWDVWGAMPAARELPKPEISALLDRLAALTLTPDASFAELHALFATDTRVRVPPVVHNALRNQPEAI